MIVPDTNSLRSGCYLSQNILMSYRSPRDIDLVPFVPLRETETREEREKDKKKPSRFWVRSSPGRTEEREISEHDDASPPAEKKILFHVKKE